MTGAAKAAAAYIAGRAEEALYLEWHSKGAADFVTEVDIGAEELLREHLLGGAKWASDAQFIGEESSDGASGTSDGLAFVVDPLDGTTNFLHGYPWYAVSIAALLDGATVAGVVQNVPTGEVFAGARGLGAVRNGRPIHVSAVSDPSRALLGTGLPFKHAGHIEPYMRALPSLLRSTAGIRRAGSAALDLCDVACGRFDAFWELSLAPWDMAAGALLVREAGGMVTDLDGRDALVAHGPIVAGNRAMHSWLIGMLDASGGLESLSSSPATA